MALIKCQECNKEISDQALACPNCGCPNIPPQNEAQKKEYTSIEARGKGIKKERKMIRARLYFGVAAFVIIIGGVLFNSLNRNRTNDRSIKFSYRHT